MKNLPLAILIVVMTLLSAAIIGKGVIEFGHVNYWYRHGFFLLVFLSFFPRLTLLLSSIPFGGLWWWLGFIFVPRYLIAILATINYGFTNPVLVTIAWVFALAGESTEKYVVQRRVFRARTNYGRRSDETIDVDSRSLD